MIDEIIISAYDETSEGKPIGRCHGLANPSRDRFPIAPYRPAFGSYNPPAYMSYEFSRTPAASDWNAV